MYSSQSDQLACCATPKSRIASHLPRFVCSCSAPAKYQLAVSGPLCRCRGVASYHLPQLHTHTSSRAVIKSMHELYFLWPRPTTAESDSIIKSPGGSRVSQESRVKRLACCAVEAESWKLGLAE